MCSWQSDLPGSWHSLCSQPAAVGWLEAARGGLGGRRSWAGEQSPQPHTEAKWHQWHERNLRARASAPSDCGSCRVRTNTGPRITSSTASASPAAPPANFPLLCPSRAGVGAHSAPHGWAALLCPAAQAPHRPAALQAVLLYQASPKHQPAPCSSLYSGFIFWGTAWSWCSLLTDLICTPQHVHLPVNLGSQLSPLQHHCPGPTHGLLAPGTFLVLLGV